MITPTSIPTLNNTVPLDDVAAHKFELAQLAEKDPEFFKYLQENDKELLDFDLGADAEDDDMEDRSDGEDDGMVEVPVLTINVLRKWQKTLLEVRVPRFRVSILR